VKFKYSGAFSVCVERLSTLAASDFPAHSSSISRMPLRKFIHARLPRTTTPDLRVLPPESCAGVQTDDEPGPGSTLNGTGVVGVETSTAASVMHYHLEALKGRGPEHEGDVVRAFIEFLGVR
jgi:hypothetical protein